jgi:hypothetical protein
LVRQWPDETNSLSWWHYHQRLMPRVKWVQQNQKSPTEPKTKATYMPLIYMNSIQKQRWRPWHRHNIAHIKHARSLLYAHATCNYTVLRLT